jgi:hypothetical protein
VRLSIAGVFLAGLLLPDDVHPFLSYSKQWFAPVLELAFLLYISYVFIRAKRSTRKTNEDFLQHCRSVLHTITGSEKAAAFIASELAVFYYLLPHRKSGNTGTQQFTSYKANGIRTVFYTLAGLLFVETIGMHFLFAQWSTAGAWVFTGLGIYTCLQVLAHTNALSRRPIVVAHKQVKLCNGLMGGEVTLPLNLIEQVVLSNGMPVQDKAVQLSLLKSMEKHNICIRLKEEVKVWKAFGMVSKTKTILLHVDGPQTFIHLIQKEIEGQ